MTERIQIINAFFSYETVIGADGNDPGKVQICSDADHGQDVSELADETVISRNVQKYGHTDVTLEAEQFEFVLFPGDGGQGKQGKGVFIFAENRGQTADDLRTIRRHLNRITVCAVAADKYTDVLEFAFAYGRNKAGISYGSKNGVACCGRNMRIVVQHTRNRGR